jgi:transposase
MMDNALAHKARTTRAQFTRDGILLMDWPANSPDLNPIEALWKLIKECIMKRRPRPTTREAMVEAIHEEWDRITPEDLDRLISSMPE